MVGFIQFSSLINWLLTCVFVVRLRCLWSFASHCAAFLRVFMSIRKAPGLAVVWTQYAERVWYHYTTSPIGVEKQFGHIHRSFRYLVNTINSDKADEGTVCGTSQELWSTAAWKLQLCYILQLRWRLMCTPLHRTQLNSSGQMAHIIKDVQHNQLFYFGQMIKQRVLGRGSFLQWDGFTSLLRVCLAFHYSNPGNFHFLRLPSWSHISRMWR